MAAPSKPPTHASCTGPPRPSHGRCDRVLLHRRVYSLSVSPDGESLLTGSADGTVRLWEVATARCERSWHVGGEKGEEVRRKKQEKRLQIKNLSNRSVYTSVCED